jgi:hypothetical protein
MSRATLGFSVMTSAFASASLPGRARGPVLESAVDQSWGPATLSPAPGR